MFISPPDAIYAEPTKGSRSFRLCLYSLDRLMRNVTHGKKSKPEEGLLLALFGSAFGSSLRRCFEPLNWLLFVGRWRWPFGGRRLQLTRLVGEVSLHLPLVLYLIAVVLPNRPRLPLSHAKVLMLQRAERLQRTCPLIKTEPRAGSRSRCTFGQTHPTM